jgi:hypothetical protein
LTVTSFLLLFLLLIILLRTTTPSFPPVPWLPPPGGGSPWPRLTDCTRVWLAGHEFAQEAWKRVVGEGGAGVIGGGDQSLQSLRRAKDMVKRELKLFEIHFAKYYGR